MNVLLPNPHTATHENVHSELSSLRRDIDKARAEKHHLLRIQQRVLAGLTALCLVWAGYRLGLETQQPLSQKTSATVEVSK